MNDIKKYKIISIFAILLIIMFIIIFLLISLQDEDGISMNFEENNITPDVVENKKIEKVKIRENYYTVKNIVDEYYSSLCILNKTAEDVLVLEGNNARDNIEKEMAKEIEANKNRLYGFFDEIYKNEIGLTITNIQEKLGNYKDLYVLIEDMYVQDITITLKLYYVFGTITEKATANKQEIQLMIAIDSDNSTFNIYTSDFIEKHNLFNLDKEYNSDDNDFNITNIENRLYNKYEYKVVNDEGYAKELLKSYTQSIKYNDINYSYNRLDEEYKTKKFPNISDYEKYIEENKKTITTSNLKQYKDNKYEGYRQYICIDQNGKCYIFNETSTMNYTLILDEYTIDLPEFIEKYNNASNDVKVGMNIEKIISAIKNSDYKYIYNKLDNTFKNNNFSTVDKLQSYIENNLTDLSDIEYLEFSEDGGIYIYKTKISNKYFNIIMQLGSGTDFTMSFNVE